MLKNSLVEWQPQTKGETNVISDYPKCFKRKSTNKPLFSFIVMIYVEKIKTKLRRKKNYM